MIISTSVLGCFFIYLTQREKDQNLNVMLGLIYERNITNKNDNNTHTNILGDLKITI